MKKTSPFKFLNAYEKADRSIFFGRDKEIEALYEMAHQSNLTLVYGKSGTGKTSLIQCGLANRFAASDWLDVFVRRKDDINTSLYDALSKQTNARESKSRSSLRERLQKRRKTTSKQDTEGSAISDTYSPVVNVLNSLYTHYFKPVYLIFDQFEELFILGDEEERRQFYQTISEIVDVCAYCHVIFVLREESIAQLYDFESVLPNLFEKRLRVEPLSRANAIEVVANTTAKFDIALEDDTVASGVIDAIASGKGQAELTYLQVFLDALYQEADEDNPVFTHDLVKKLGGIEDVLADFLKTQSERIQLNLLRTYSGVSERSVRNVLNAFVTLEGTKQPIVLSQLHIPSLSDEQVEYCVKELESARILRFSDDRYELSHDALAARIAASRSTVDIAYLEAVKLIKERSKAFQSTQTYLSASEISFIQPYRKRIDAEAGLKPEEVQYIGDSIRADRKRKRKRNRQIAVVGTLLTIGFLTSVVLWLGTKEANYGRLIQMGDAAVGRSDFPGAIAAFENAVDVKRSSIEAEERLESASNMQKIHVLYVDLIEDAEKLTLLDTNRTYLANCDSLLKAKDLYTEALALDISRTARHDATNKKQAVQNELKVIFGDLERRGDIMKAVDKKLGYSNALPLYEQALKVNPDNSLVRQKIEICKQNLQE
ncbi:MAG: hypothetical protein DRI69_01440 [Bacteroidetes bacterium]|nr:MAG: hypothetical protein DRI69_01440 [Bacteroidota bacterium]